MKVIVDGQCLHTKWCSALPGQPHADTCPRSVLKLSDDDVLRFAATFVEKHPIPKNPSRYYVIGRYKGLMAKCTLGRGIEAEHASVRWLAENLLMTARERGL